MDIEFKIEQFATRNQTTKRVQSLALRVPCEVYSRVVGYLRPVQNWNVGKQQEFKERCNFRIRE
ncbi:MAG: hypothetical protein HPY45_05020 [Anaerolineae bacterium]|nr:hypothetical protein [Anaerolineae bacterium]